MLYACGQYRLPDQLETELEITRSLRIGDGTTRHQHQINVVASIEGHLDDALVVDHLALRRFDSIEPADG